MHPTCLSSKTFKRCFRLDAGMQEDDLLYGPRAAEAPKPKHKEDPQVESLLKAVSDIETRLRVLEERYTNLRRRTQITDQNMLDTEKHLSTEIKSAHEQLSQLSDTLGEVSNKLALFSSEFAGVAKRTDLVVIEKYLDLWQPMQFVTRDEVKAILKDLFEQKSK